MTDLSEFFRDISNEPSEPTDMKALLAQIAQISATVPMTDWKRLPSDFAENHDFYLYGRQTRK